MRLKIIGSAAGGGFPQWNCNFRLSRAARAGEQGFAPRTQSSLAASADGSGWVLFNASPDIRQQIAQTPELQPAPDAPLRSTPIRAVVLTNADVDHVAGLLSLREREPFAIYATRRVLEVIAANSIFNVLDPKIVPRRLLPPDETVIIRDARNRDTGLSVESFSVPGKIALYLEDASRPAADFGSEAGDTIGVRVSAANGGKAAYYVPGCADINERLRIRLDGAACLLFDGTVFTDDEMLTAGVGQKTGRRMGHLAMWGENGSVAELSRLKIGRRVFVHINNTNPVLDDTSPERAALRTAGWEVAHDGMEIVL
ncbi:pyrroloquinoline quinone biosynthesis protein PqqB [Mesorhizobium sp. IMUNJ 23232]|uniref:pyrroloquinoline quinone biosynthesis protein PqqB n=1 Tax=Mesorhizobium sp. IMUNJ 23232 TaxID=3376064 RepID=UPI0037895831